MDCKKIGEYIQRKRKAIKITQQELGDKLGVTDKAVSKWETGIALPDVSLYKDLCEILNISVEELLNGEDNKSIPIDKKKNIIIICLSIIVSFLLVISLLLGIFFYQNYNKVHVYDLESASNEFRVDGKLIVIGDKSYISINNVKYNHKNNFIISNIDYELLYRKRVLVEFNEKNDSLIFLEDYLNNFAFFCEFIENIDLNQNDFLKLKMNVKLENDELVAYYIKIKIK